MGFQHFRSSSTIRVHTMSRRRNKPHTSAPQAVTKPAHVSTLNFMAAFENPQMALLRPYIARELYIDLAPRAIPFPAGITQHRHHGYVVNIRLNAAQRAEFARQLKCPITEYPWIGGDIFCQGNGWFRIYGFNREGALRILAALVMRAQLPAAPKPVLPPIVSNRYAIIVPPKHVRRVEPTNRARSAASTVVSMGGYRAARSANLTERIRALMPA